MKHALEFAVRLVVIAALFVATHAEAAQPRLAADCSYAAFTPSESTPFDLDWCDIAFGDDISLLLDDILVAWPTGFYVRAPSRTLTVQASYRAWSSTTKTYMFLEDESPLNKLTIQHIAVATNCSGSACEAYWKLWAFTNYTTVKIGGPNLSITFVGNHPGFGNCAAQQYYIGQVSGGGSDPICDSNRGLLDFRVTDNSIPQLLDVRANVRYAQHYGLYANGGQIQFPHLDPSGHTIQCNIAGVYYATGGIFLHDGACKDAWFDPDRTVITDPYLRAIGWQGHMASGTDAGRPVACRVDADEQYRQSAGACYYCGSIKGGVTLEYGAMAWGQRYLGSAGTGTKDPFIVRVKDWGLSGPIEKACPAGIGGCTPGARGKKGFESNFFKGDPHDTPDTGSTLRFVRFVALTSQYGQGWGAAGTSGCPSNFGDDGDANFARLENSVSGRLNRDWSVEFAGDWRRIANGGVWKRDSLLLMSWDSIRSYRHVVRAADGMIFDDTLELNDTNTATGPGTYTNLTIADGEGATGCTANTVTNTNVSGVVTVNGSCGTTTISNVNFTGSARAVITIGSGSTVAASNLCVPDTSTITGTGTLTYDGAGKTLPYTITPIDGCNTATIADPAPQPVTGGSVQ